MDNDYADISDMLSSDKGEVKLFCGDDGSKALTPREQVAVLRHALNNGLHPQLHENNESATAEVACQAQEVRSPFYIFYPQPTTEEAPTTSLEAYQLGEFSAS